MKNEAKSTVRTEQPASKKVSQQTTKQSMPIRAVAVENTERSANVEEHVAMLLETSYNPKVIDEPSLAEEEEQRDDEALPMSRAVQEALAMASTPESPKGLSLDDAPTLRKYAKLADLVDAASAATDGSNSASATKKANKKGKSKVRRSAAKQEQEQAVDASLFDDAPTAPDMKKEKKKKKREDMSTKGLIKKIFARKTKNKMDKKSKTVLKQKEVSHVLAIASTEHVPKAAATAATTAATTAAVTETQAFAATSNAFLNKRQSSKEGCRSVESRARQEKSPSHRSDTHEKQNNGSPDTKTLEYLIHYYEQKDKDDDGAVENQGQVPRNAQGENGGKVPILPATPYTALAEDKETRCVEKEQQQPASPSSLKHAKSAATNNRSSKSHSRQNHKSSTKRQSSSQRRSQLANDLELGDEIEQMVYCCQEELAQLVSKVPGIFQTATKNIPRSPTEMNICTSKDGCKETAQSTIENFMRMATACGTNNEELMHDDSVSVLTEDAFSVDDQKNIVIVTRKDYEDTEEPQPAKEKSMISLSRVNNENTAATSVPALVDDIVDDASGGDGLSGASKEESRSSKKSVCTKESMPNISNDDAAVTGNSTPAVDIVDQAFAKDGLAVPSKEESKSSKKSLFSKESMPNVSNDNVAANGHSTPAVHIVDQAFAKNGLSGASKEESQCSKKPALSKELMPDVSSGTVAITGASIFAVGNVGSNTFATDGLAVPSKEESHSSKKSVLSKDLSGRIVATATPQDAGNLEDDQEASLKLQVICDTISKECIEVENLDLSHGEEEESLTAEESFIGKKEEEASKAPKDGDGSMKSSHTGASGPKSSAKPDHTEQEQEPMGSKPEPKPTEPSPVAVAALRDAAKERGRRNARLRQTSSRNQDDEERDSAFDRSVKPKSCMKTGSRRVQENQKTDKFQKTPKTSFTLKVGRSRRDEGQMAEMERLRAKRQHKKNSNTAPGNDEVERARIKAMDSCDSAYPVAIGDKYPIFDENSEDESVNMRGDINPVLSDLSMGVSIVLFLFVL